MNEQIAEVLNHIREFEDKLEVELDKNRALYGVLIKGKIAEFRQDVITRHRQLRMGLIQFMRASSIANIAVMPIIYSMLVPIALIDVWVTIYQHICFRAYGIARVPRSEYVLIDRQHLAYLNLIEKLNCVYCGYGNGVFAYAREIASRTEQYWCPIKHARRVNDPHQRYLKFLEYGDAEGYRAKLTSYRNDFNKAG